jgi:hypothetical protein
MFERIRQWFLDPGLGILFGSLLILLGACKSEQPSTRGGLTQEGLTQGGLTQGVKGTVRWFEGNLMPSPDVPAPDGQPVVREILFCKPASAKGAAMQGPLLAVLPTEVVLTVTSNAKGEFEAALAPGTYSVFVREKEGFFSDYQSDRYLSPCVVEAGKVTKRPIKIDYKATY